MEFAICSCGAGLSGACKHIVAVIYYLNSTTVLSSKTDHSQTWGKSSQLHVYKKGVTVGTHHPAPQLKKHALKTSSHRFVLEDLKDIPCTLKIMLQAELITKSKSNVNFIMDILIDRVISLSISNNISRVLNYVKLSGTYFESYSYSESCDVINEKKDFYYNNIVLNDEDIRMLAEKTISQSSSSDWFSERKKEDIGKYITQNHKL